ncbi:hypothetical protein FB45DRAFT_1000600 [Roridomyces roridus]|uniref:Uncharacterized protein n=1 Tax=Roridomyces roridus TaxID=1738132 RepID=A0AAD7FTV9_9AGAR|nr:hypothetical protein FB45DRAFT_1000600 [Roridomyces roridus]
MQSGWVRFHSFQICNKSIGTFIFCPNNFHLVQSWLSQANGIFDLLNLQSDYDCYVLVQKLHFQVNVSAPRWQDAPAGYLFLCLPGNLQTGPMSFRWPENSCFWSLEPSGTVPLRAEEAQRRGFPAITFHTTLLGYFFDDSVYAGLRDFHMAKELREDLNVPLFVVSS